MTAEQVPKTRSVCNCPAVQKDHGMISNSQKPQPVQAEEIFSGSPAVRALELRESESFFQLRPKKLSFHQYARFLELFRLLASYTVGQATAQALGFLAGILIVRTIPKEDYAWFMIVNTIGPVMGMLSDNGVTNSLAAIGGKFWQDDLRMGSLVKTALLLRKRLIVFSFMAVAPVLAWMLWRNHAPPAIIAFLVLITLTGVFFQLNMGVLNAVLSLRQQVRRMQAVVFMGMLPRLALIGLFAALGWLNAPLALASVTVALAAQFWLLKKWVYPQIAANAPPDAGLRRDILSIVKRQAPLTIYFCIQSQIGVWLISIFGNANRVADLGALGRLGMIFSILMATTSALIVPRFARCQDPARLRSYYGQILLVFAGIILSGTLFAWWLPGPLLWLLGGQYAQLGGMVWLAVLASGSANIAGLAYSLNMNKGWIPPAYIIIPAEIVTQVVLCLVFKVSTVPGILMIGVLAPIVPGLINLYIGIRRLDSNVAISGK